MSEKSHSPTPPQSRLPNIDTRANSDDSDKFTYKQSLSPLKSRIASGTVVGVSPRGADPSSASSYHDWDVTELSSSPPKRKIQPPPHTRARSCSLEPSSLDEAKQSLQNFHSRNEEFRNVLRCMMKIGRGTNIHEAEQAIMQASCEILKSDRSDIFLFDVCREKLRSSTRVGR